MWNIAGLFLICFPRVMIVCKSVYLINVIICLILCYSPVTNYVIIVNLATFFYIAKYLRYIFTFGSLFSDKFLTIKYKGPLRKFYRSWYRFIIAITILFRNLPQIVNQAFSSTTKSVSTTLSICHIFQLLRNWQWIFPLYTDIPAQYLT